MARYFQAQDISFKISGALDKLKAKVHNRPLGLCVQGKSIKELEVRIDEFQSYDICWGAMNRFDIYQKYIFDKIGKKLEVVMDVGEVKYVEAYEKGLRIPRWKDYLKNPNSLLITSEEIINNLATLCNWDILSEYKDQIIVIHKCREVPVPNSMMLYILFLTQIQVQKIFLFGFDGFGNPKAFKDTPIWNPKEFDSEHYCNKTLTAYYKPETVLEERRIGYQDERASDLHSNCPTFNDQFHETMRGFCRKNGVSRPTIINCSINSLYTVFRKIDYNQLKGELN